MNSIDLIFAPESAAVVGASNDPTKWGAGIFARILNSPLAKKLYPVNSKNAIVQGVKAYPSIKDLPEPVDFAAIVVPYPYIPQVIRECAEKGVKTALIITAGLSETGEEGSRIEREIVSIAHNAGMRLVGPNCMGHFNTANNFSTLRMNIPIQQGKIGVISQSGGFAMHILMCGMDIGVGFSKFVSVGNEADLHFEDFLEYMGQDKETKVITGYIEGLRKGREFFKLAKEISKEKPIVVVKVGKTEAGAQAARSHTSAIAGSDMVYDAMFKQSGVIRVNEVEELFDVASALLRQPLPKGNRIGILTGGGGFGCIASDACEESGLKVALLSKETIRKLNTVLSDRWPHGNPVDMVATGTDVVYKCLWPLLEDENIDAVLIVGGIGMASTYPLLNVNNAKTLLQQADNPLSALDYTQQLLKKLQDEELASIDKLSEYMDKYQKPVIISTYVNEATKASPVFEKLKNIGVFIYPTPERAVKVLGHLYEYSRYRNNL